MNSNTNLKIVIDPNTHINRLPVANKIVNGKLIPLKTFSASNDNDPKEFELNNFDGAANSDIVVVYSVMLGDSDTYTNVSYANEVYVSATVNQIRNNGLPDLF